MTKEEYSLLTEKEKQAYNKVTSEYFQELRVKFHTREPRKWRNLGIFQTLWCAAWALSNCHTYINKPAYSTAFVVIIFTLLAVWGVRVWRIYSKQISAIKARLAESPYEVVLAFEE